MALNNNKCYIQKKNIMGAPKKPKIMTAWYIKQQQQKQWATTLMLERELVNLTGPMRSQCKHKQSSSSS